MRPQGTLRGLAPCWLALLSLFPALSPAQPQTKAVPSHVFHIVANECPGLRGPVHATGFRVKDQRGIYTALHAVAGCPKIRASPADPDEKSFDGLEIRQADVARDVAVLSSTELDALEHLPGLTALTNPDWKTVTALYTRGHPGGMLEQLPTPLFLRDTASPWVFLRKLSTVDGEMDDLWARESPDPKLRFLNMKGHLTHGHSGAPILLEGSDEIVAIGIGGLKDGYLEISFATALEDVQLEDVRQNPGPLQSLLERIKPRRPPALFFAEENINAGTAFISFTRKAVECGAGVSLDVYLQEQQERPPSRIRGAPPRARKLGSVDNGKSQSFSVPAGPYDVWVSYDYYRSKKLQVLLEKNQTLSLSGAFGKDCFGFAAGDFKLSIEHVP